MRGITREELIAQGCTEKRNRKGASYFEDVTGEIVAKVCTKCCEVTAMSGFAKKKSGFEGRGASCNACQSESIRNYHEANPDKRCENVRKYRKSNSEKMRKATRRWVEANPERKCESDRKYREDNSEKVSECQRKWREANPEKRALSRQRRRARKASLPDALTLEQQTAIVTHFNGGCALTGSTEYHMDHAIPLACGHGGTTYGNMVPLRDDLNLSKNDANIFEWFNANRERFNLSQSKFNALITYLAEVNGMTLQEYRAYVDWCFDNPRALDEELPEEESAC